MNFEPTVESIMTRRVLSVDMDRSLEHVRRVFEEATFHHLVVVEDSKLVGLISDRDLFKAISPFAGTLSEQSKDANTLRKAVHQIMSRDITTCTPGTTVREAGRLMLDGKFSCLPVVEGDGRCVGIVTVRDLAKWAVELLSDLWDDGASWRAA